MKRALLVLSFLFVQTASAQSRIDFWQHQQKGVNCFNREPARQWFEDAARARIRFVRLTFTKWQGKGRDFLLGNADHFEFIPDADRKQLLRVLDWAHEFQIKVVVVPLSLPGARWSQQNEGKFDPRLWQDFSYHKQSSRFWMQLATALRGHPAVVGYEILNEPAPERALNAADEWEMNFDAFESEHVNTPADLNLLYSSVVPAIRSVDLDTPIILDCGFFGFAGAIKNLKPVDDGKIIYSFHNYEPYAYTNFRVNAGRFTYPGPVVTGGKPLKWDATAIRWHLARVADWAEQHNIPANRIWAGEFGCDRRVPGAARYLSDLVEILNSHVWHWCVYSFREDEWDAFDYECGSKPLPGNYWQAIERGEKPIRPRVPNDLWSIFQREFRVLGRTWPSQ